MGLVWRRKYFIDPKLQLKIILFLGATAVVFSALILFVAHLHFKSVGAAAPGVDLGEFDLLIKLGFCFGIMTVYFMIVGLLLSSRIAGPIWRLQDQLNRYFSGEKINAIKFRDDDEFKEVAILVNRLLDRAPKN